MRIPLTKALALSLVPLLAGPAAARVLPPEVLADKYFLEETRAIERWQEAGCGGARVSAN